jgi:hypothetical protein
LEFREHLWKQKRVKFLRGEKKTKSEKLELVHTNVWGLAHVSSLGGSYYYVTFIDGATRKLGFIVFNFFLMFLIF